MPSEQPNPENTDDKSHNAGGVPIPARSEKLNFVEPAIPSRVAVEMEATQIGKFSTKGGTGFAAEDANALFDERLGHSVERVGLDNSKNGADRVVNGVSIQTKYFDSASRTVGSAFDKDTGLYRYESMQLEVPKDQYEAAVKAMSKRIEDGKVPGFSNPEDATKLIKEGSTTYQQAKNIARAGNIDSLTYDARNGAVLCGAAFGFSFAVEYGSALWSGESAVNALKTATLGGLKTSGVAFFTSVGSAQLLRTQAARAGTIFVKSGLKEVAKTSLGKSTVEKIAHVSLGKAVYGASAVNHVSKLLRSNAITGAVTVTVLTLPDLYKAAISGSKSWAQIGKNFVVNGSGVAASTAGWAGGAAAGAAAGSVVPVVGTVIGGAAGAIAGALGAGVAGGVLAKKAMDYFVNDDAIEMRAILAKEIEAIAFDHVMAPTEYQKFHSFIGDAVPSGFWGGLHAAKSRPQYIRDAYEEHAFEIVKQRKPIVMPADQAVLTFISTMLEQAESTEDLSDDEPLDPSADAPNSVVELPREPGPDNAGASNTPGTSGLAV